VCKKDAGDCYQPGHVGYLSKIEKAQLQLVCEGWHLYIAFNPSHELYSWQDIMGNQVTVLVENIDDLVGNRMDGFIKYSFEVETFDLSLTASTLLLRFADLTMDAYVADANELEQQFKSEVKKFTGEDTEVTINGVTAGSVMVDFTLSPNGAVSGTKLLDAISAAANGSQSSFLGLATVQEAKLVDLTKDSESEYYVGGCRQGHCFSIAEIAGIIVAVVLGWLLFCVLLAYAVRVWKQNVPPGEAPKKFKCLCKVNLGFGFFRSATALPGESNQTANGDDEAPDATPKPASAPPPVASSTLRSMIPSIAVTPPPAKKDSVIEVVQQTSVTVE